MGRVTGTDLHAFFVYYGKIIIAIKFMKKTNEMDLASTNSVKADRQVGNRFLCTGYRKCVQHILIPCILVICFMILWVGCSEMKTGSDSSDSLPKYVFFSGGNGGVRIYNTKNFTWSDLMIGSNARFSTICDNAFWVKTGNMTVLYKISDREVKPSSSRVYSDVTRFVAGRALVGDGTQPIQIIDTDGNIVATMPDDVEYANTFTTYGLATVQTSDKKTGIIDKDGKYVVTPKYQTAMILSPDRFLVGALAATPSTGLDYYIIDKSGKTISNLSAKYTDFDAFHYGDGLFAQVKYDEEGQSMNNVAFINENGDKVFDLDILSSEATDENYSFKHGLLAYPAVGGRWKVANTHGETVYEGKCEHITIASHDRLIVNYTYRQSAVVDLKGNFAIPITNDVTFEALANNSYLCKQTEYFDGIYAGAKYFVQHNENRTPMYTDATTGDDSVCRDGIWYTNLGNVIMPLISGIKDGKFFGYSSSMTAPDVAHKAGAEIRDESEALAYMEYSLNVKLVERTTMADVYGFALFDSKFVYEKTHIEREGSGWFVTEKEVADGYAFNPNARLEGFYITYNTLAPDIKKEDFSNAVAGTLTKSGFKATNGTSFEKDGIRFSLMEEWRVGDTRVGPGILINF